MLVPRVHKMGYPSVALAVSVLKDVQFGSCRSRKNVLPDDNIDIAIVINICCLQKMMYRFSLRFDHMLTPCRINFEGGFEP
jgi:hypothetical protein